MTELVAIPKEQEQIKLKDEKEDFFLPEFNKKVVKLFKDAFWKSDLCDMVHSAKNYLSPKKSSSTTSCI